jgi:hypothetical protein
MVIINKFSRADTGKDDLDDNHKAVTDKNESNDKILRNNNNPGQAITVSISNFLTGKFIFLS